MARPDQSPVAMMAASQFYRVLLERSFGRSEQEVMEMIPKTTVIADKNWVGSQAVGHEARE